MTVLIAGGGIGGLTAALSLHAVGIEARVVESVREIRPLGVGINLLPHSVRELIELGLGDELAAIGVATAENVYADRFGNEIYTEPRGIAQGYKWPQYSVHRGRLQTMLFDAVRERLGPDAVRTGVRLTDFTDTGDAVRAELSDRGTGRTETVEASALIGADGIHSVVRAKLHPGEGPLRYSGIRMWRGVTETEPFLTGRSMVIVREGGVEIIAYPISPRHVNWVCLVRMSEPGPLVEEEAGWNRPGRLEDLLPYYRDWNLGYLDVPALLSGSDVLLEYPMADREPLSSWGRGRVTLLGDAAHPMWPVGANGASQSVLDARTLAAELARAADVPAGLAAYEAVRVEATANVVLANRNMNKAAEKARLARRDFGRITDTYRRETGAEVHVLNERASLTPGG
ncbi:flavin-dependent oxidoreductase [Streptomyces luteireticuli]|uniref:Flavin-dependent oxidoreductase n=1 Tax=Streptomyces luteireticuli TaxID=173858 RepID=A0ABN0YNL5_9ACTN